jgi:phospholipase/carboxylesterase
MTAPGWVDIPGVARPVLRSGAAIDEAQAAMVMIHGRGASAEDIIGLAPMLAVPGFIHLAPQAEGGAWYPAPFTAPLEANEPFLPESLAVIGGLLDYLDETGIPAERTVLLGFSQGACLALEFAARSPRRYGGVVGLSGGLIGPDGLEREQAGSLDGTPVFLGCSDVDPWIPAGRVQFTEEYLERIGGAVDLRIYPGMGHTIVGDELEAARGIMVALSR